MEEADDFATPPQSSIPIWRSSRKLSLPRKPTRIYKRVVKKPLVYKNIKSRKVNTFSRLFDSMSLVKDKLRPHQLKLFQKTVFGPFLDVRKWHAVANLFIFC
ncbi:unnamed protein product [Cuscuta epithymum]|uniref:Uncharacterized protein n=1 Tax=Cuscuta epithymum TaxID=186058 RepID=A0AAV0FUV6_9ASTE|nr:unnamed protein product [Cuscuta epithymum]